MLEFEELNQKFEKWDESLLPKEKKYLHYKSISNFLFHFSRLTDERIREKALMILSNYFEEVEENEFDYQGSKSYTLSIKFIDKLGEIYKQTLGFKSIMNLGSVIMFSILGDGLIFLFLRNIIPFYFPIVSLLLFINYFRFKLFFEKKKIVYGLFY